MKGVTAYGGLSGLYFRCLLKTLIWVGQLDRPGITILDFGCGRGELKRLLPEARLVGYDILPELSDVADWHSVDFDLLVANEVFYSFTEPQLEALLTELKGRKKGLQLVVGISRQSWLNRLGMLLTGRGDAHSASRLAPARERAILQKHCRVLKRRGVLGLADVYSMEFL